LLDRPKQIIYAVPKRAFPDEAAQNWFRSLANQPQSVAAPVDEGLTPGRVVRGGAISLTMHLKFRDYVSRGVTTWLLKGILIGVFVLITAINIFSTPPPDAVNSP